MRVIILQNILAAYIIWLGQISIILPTLWTRPTCLTQPFQAFPCFLSNSNSVNHNVPRLAESFCSEATRAMQYRALCSVHVTSDSFHYSQFLNSPSGPLQMFAFVTFMSCSLQWDWWPTSLTINEKKFFTEDRRIVCSLCFWWVWVLPSSPSSVNKQNHKNYIISTLSRTFCFVSNL